MLPDRIAAVIIRNKKLLLVTNNNKNFYWTPGGKIEPGESHETALVRELQEELRVAMTSMKHYFMYKTINEATGKEQLVYCYFVNIEGEIIPSEEITDFAWFSQKKLLQTPTTTGINKFLIPKILADGLL